MLKQLKKIFNAEAEAVDESWFTTALVNSKYTPDYGMLEQQNFHLIFIYDSMMFGRSKMPSSTAWFRLGGAFTRNEFVMFTKKAGVETFPIPLPPQKSENRAKIKGEIWAITPKEFLWLDREKENTVSFTRKKVHVNVPHRKVVWTKESQGAALKEERSIKIPVWMYVGRRDYWGDLLDGGYLFGEASRYDPKEPNRTQYYYFSTRDYEE